HALTQIQAVSSLPLNPGLCSGTIFTDAQVDHHLLHHRVLVCCCAAHDDHLQRVGTSVKPDTSTRRRRSTLCSASSLRTPAASSWTVSTPTPSTRRSGWHGSACSPRSSDGTSCTVVTRSHSAAVPTRSPTPDCGRPSPGPVQRTSSVGCRRGSTPSSDSSGAGSACPVVSGSASPWLASTCATPGCGSSTSRPPASMQRQSDKCSPSCTASAPTTSPSWSRTEPGHCGRWTASMSSTTAGSSSPGGSPSSSGPVAGSPSCSSTRRCDHCLVSDCAIPSTASSDSVCPIGATVTSDTSFAGWPESSAYTVTSDFGYGPSEDSADSTTRFQPFIPPIVTASEAVSCCGYSLSL